MSTRCRAARGRTLFLVDGKLVKSLRLLAKNGLFCPSLVGFFTRRLRSDTDLDKLIVVQCVRDTEIGNTMMGYVNSSLLRRIVVALAVVCLIVGCEFSNPKPPSGQLEIEKAASWFHRFRRMHRGKAPKDEGELVEFIEAEFDALGESVDAVEMLTSPRDGQTFEMLYGKKARSKNPDENIACYEREGYGGKRLVAYESLVSKEVDESELDSLIGP